MLGASPLREIAGAHGKSPAQVVLRWHMQQEPVAAVPRSSSREHIAENLDIFDFELQPDEMKRIDTLAQDRRLIDPSWAPDWER